MRVFTSKVLHPKKEKWNNSKGSYNVEKQGFDIFISNLMPKGRSTSENMYRRDISPHPKSRLMICKSMANGCFKRMSGEGNSK